MERKINQITVCPDKEGLKSCWFLNQEASDFAADRRAMRGSTKQLSSRGRDKGVSKKCLEKKNEEHARIFRSLLLLSSLRGRQVNKLRFYLFENSHACPSLSIHEVLFRLALKCRALHCQELRITYHFISEAYSTKPTFISKLFRKILTR